MSEEEIPKPASAVINRLLEEYDISVEKLLSELFRNGKGFEKKVASRWISGASQPRRRGREELAQFFKLYNPDTTEYWFESSIEETEHLISKNSTPLCVTYPSVRNDAAELFRYSDALSGLWLTKRFAFENTGRIARELMRIKPCANGKMFVDVYGVTSSGMNPNCNFSEELFQGELSIFGEMATIQVAYHDGIVGRFRCFGFRKPPEGRAERAHWATVMGYSSVKEEAACCRMLMLRVQNQKNLEENKNIVLGFRDLDKDDEILKKILSNDIKTDHVSKEPDHILTVSRQDLIEDGGNPFFNRIVKEVFE